MKNLALRIGLLSLVCVIGYGFGLSHKTVKAASSMTVYQEEVIPGLSAIIPGTVVGYACYPEHVGSIENIHCYIAYVNEH
jgi:hypothetical protein